MMEDQLSAATAPPGSRSLVASRAVVSRITTDVPAGRVVRQAVLESLPQLLWTAAADGHVDFHNERCRAFLGITPDAWARHWTAPIHPADLSAVLDDWQHCLAGRAVLDTECRVRRHDGAWCWVRCRVSPDRGPDDHVRGWTGSFDDIDDLKRGLERSNLASAEIAHRLRNVYAVVGALLMLSARSEPQARAFANAARDRLCALSRAHELVHPGEPSGLQHATTLHDLLSTLLEPYQPSVANPVIVISGSDAPVSGEAVMSLGLLVHELVSNALKHGALSVPGGMIRITTVVLDGNMHLTWQETGGPAISAPPERHGFGSTLFERALPSLTGAQLDRRWAPQGLIATLSVPLAALAG